MLFNCMISSKEDELENSNKKRILNVFEIFSKRFHNDTYVNVSFCPKPALYSSAKTR